MMESVLVCLILLSASGLRWAQHAAALPASTVQVRVGEDATLQCPLQDASHAFTTLSWYRKVAGQRPQLLLTVRSTNTFKVKYGAGLGPDKVSAAPDGSLLLHDSEQSDSAVYYCSVTQGEAQKKKATLPDLTGK